MKNGKGFKNKKSAQTYKMKKLYIFIAFNILLGNYAMAFFNEYDFYAECESGHTLYYRFITYEKEPSVEIVRYQYAIYKGDIVIPESVIHNDTTYAVVYICSEAFLRQTEVTSVTIPNSITCVSENAFDGCTGITKPVYNSHLFAYYPRHLSATEYAIPEGIQRIERGAFYKCSNLTSIKLPNSLTSIGYDAFSGTGWYNNQPDGILYNDDWCIGYKGNATGIGIVINEGIKHIADGAFAGEYITSVTMPNSVKSIGAIAFSDCEWLQHATLGDSVRSIGYEAFDYCYNLRTINLGNSLKEIKSSTFENCSSLDSIIIPNSVESIGYGAFSYCIRLKSVKLGNSLKKIGNNAFESCFRLKSITIPNSVTVIGEEAFLDCYNITYAKIGDSVTEIKLGAFMECYRLESVEFGKSLKKICSDVFINCENLKSITIPNTVTEIEDGAFIDCPNIASIVVEEGNSFYDSRNNCNAIIETATNALLYGCKNTIIPNSVTTISDDAFNGCNGLKSLTIPNSVTSIGNSAFYHCTNLKSITIPKSVTHIEKNSFGWNRLETIIVEEGNTVYDSRNNCNAIIETATNALFFGCKNTIIPSSVTSISDDAFYGCFGLKSLTIPNSVTSIGNTAFYYCENLKSVTLGNSVNTIGFYAFSGCTKLKSINIPNSIREIGNGAFACCKLNKETKARISEINASTLSK